MLSYSTHPQEIDDLVNLINKNQFFSIAFIKRGDIKTKKEENITDADVRYFNGRKKAYKPTPDANNKTTSTGSGEQQQQNTPTSYSRKDYNLFMIWDNNAVDNRTGEKGAYRQMGIENILFIKAGSFLKDYIKENDIAKRFPLLNVDNVRTKMKIGTPSNDINEIIAEEIENY
jgi:hypothetical protein